MIKVGTHAERAEYGDKQRSRYCWVPDELEHEVDAWYSDARRAEVWRLQFFIRFFFLLDSHGSNFVLGVSCAPNIEPSSTGRSTVKCFLCYSFNSHFGWIFLTSCPVAVAAEGSVPLGTPRMSATCLQTSLPTVSQDPGLIFIEVLPVILLIIGLFPVQLHSLVYADIL